MRRTGRGAGLAGRCELPALLCERVKIAAVGGVNATAKILSLVAGMIAGADSIDDMGLLRSRGPVTIPV